MSIQIAASILSADFAKLGEEVKKVSDLDADLIHIDVMDGNFVPNITIGPGVMSAIRPYSSLPFDVHLMINSPSNHIEAFVNAGANIITIHAETEVHLDKVIRKIKSYGVKAGISIIPSTHPSVLEYIIHELDVVLVMSVNPGFGGQEFLTSQLDKISKIKCMIKKIATKIAVDGGVTASNASSIIKAGADILVMGSAVFKAEDIAKTIYSIKSLF
ncbi:MAG: ribulose-phosphate 3-epimerase [Candidatus Mesenet longicola]|uniref:Ribulose-phosphate 3-epimerase n=1 Tax=Candidatus Mesenet longicola TaxID=1892558 RepID=A0A8J3HYP5_9RICK|nr:MAG: ribulose-phosphate 3-epimerase [Candidatus Mesenet longicola]GHM60001.1 MAG: ribulose-phosphate 3-epimerase [Candidatus Mesenet longicola]